MVFSFLGVTGCSKTDRPTSEEVRQALTAGTWHISLFSKGGTVYYDFEDYDFTFSANGTVMGQKGGTDIGGTWSLWEPDGNTTLDLDMGNTGTFGLLDNHWEVTDASSTRVKTENDAAGPVSYLTFEKN